MGDKKQPFGQSESDKDEFDIFGENFDFDKSEDEEPVEYGTEGSTFSDEAKESEHTDDMFGLDAEDEPLIVPPAMGGLSGLMGRLKKESPRTLFKYGLIGLVGVIFVIGALLKLFSPSAPPATSAISNIAPPSTNTLAMNNVSATPAPMPQEMQLGTVDATDLNKRVSTVEGQLAQLDNQLGGLSQMNNSNQTQIAQIIDAVNRMQSEVDKVDKALNLLLVAASQQQVASVSSQAAASPTPSYYVQAVIPGRAWLKSPNGQVITVSLGDAIPGYGTVINIDPQQGQVSTSTNATFVFGQGGA